MISVRSRDGSKGLGLGFNVGGVGRKMEEAELEEGEAYSFQDNGDSDARIDPDLSLSYIDEKLQDVLGHFQKDFEGGVSAENLGAKFGGYGSFLPTVRRSPVCSHPRTPPKVQNHSLLKSPNNGQVWLSSGDGHDPIVSSVKSQSGRSGPSTSHTSLSVTKGRISSESVKQEVHNSFIHNEAIRNKSGKKKIKSLSDHKTLKVRIKVGSDNLSTRQNAAIYSGLGLDVSPSSSLDDAPSDNEGMCHELQHTSFESPTSILQIMTSFPIQGGLLLSPLPVDLIHLCKKERHSNDAQSLLPGNGWESDGALGNGDEVSKSSGKFSLEKKLKPMKGNGFSSEFKGGTNKASQNSTVAMPKKEPEIDFAACEKLISNTLKLPLLSNLCSSSEEKTNNMGRTADGFGKANKVMVQDAMFIERDEKELVGPSSGCASRKHKNGPATKVWEDKNNSPVNEISAFSTIDEYQKEGKTFESAIVNSKGKKFKNEELTDPPKKKPIETFTPQQHDNATCAPAIENTPPEGKNKSKRSETNSFLAENTCSKSLRIVESKVNNSAKVVKATNEIESEHIKSQKNLEKNKDRYRDFFGDVDEEENQVDSLDIPSKDRLKSSDLIEKGAVAFSGSLKGRPSGALYTIDSVALEDYWVGCDKCQQWRLLPLGIYPENLPEKWICSMLDWLPGMNHCSVSEEETTKALIAQRQAAASAIVTQGNIGHVQDPVQNHPNYDMPVFPSGGKKKNGAKDITAGMVKGGPSQWSTLTKKKIQTSLKDRSINNMNQSPLGSENDFTHMNLSKDVPMEKHKTKHKEKQKGLHLHSNGDITKSIKVKSKRGLDQDFSGSYKKIKSKGMDFSSDDRTSDHSGTIIKISHCSKTANINASVGKEQPRHTDEFSKDSKNESRKRQQASVGKIKDEAMASLNSGSQNAGGGESKDIIKKRKVKQSLEGRDFLEESDSRKEKKAKVFDSEGKESSGSKGSGRHRKKGTPLEHQRLGQQKSLDDGDSLKRDMGCVHASVGATSSSSKISGSRRTKSRFQEVKGSPVESVSSSPMRISKQNNTQASRNFPGKDVSEDALFSINSPNGDNDGRSDQSRTRRKDKPSVVLCHESLDFPLPDALEKDIGHGRDSKSRVQVMPSPDANNHRVNGGLDSQGIDPCLREQSPDYQYPDESEQINTQFQANEIHPSRSGKGSSSCLKDEIRSNNLSHYQVKIDSKDSLNELQRSLPPAKDGKKESKKFRIKSEKTENKCVNKKDSAKIPSNEIGATQPKLEEREYLDVRVKSAAHRKDEMFNSKQNQLQGSNSERSSNRNLSDRTDQVEIDYERVKSLPLPTPGEGQSEMPIECSRPIGGLQEGNTVDVKQIKKVDNQNGVHNSRHTTVTGRRASDNPSPARRDSSNQAATNALKEAKDLKHLADRLKNSGSNHERTGMYFEAALKFLNAASLMESCSSGSKQSEMIQSMQIYSSTAKLCEFCAIEYEKCKDMAAAALAYKCMEVAFMRVIYSSHNNASRDRNELQTALQLVPPCNYGWQGESPSSSASDVDNLNNPTTVDKANIPKGVGSPQVIGSHVITAKNRPNFVRLLSYAQDVSSAMEASRKSRIAFSAANEGGKIGDNILVIKRALDFNFHDVDGLLHLVRLAMESISR